jgi:hypothetical protein
MQISVVPFAPVIWAPSPVTLRLCTVSATLAIAALLAAISAKPPATLAIEVNEVFI